MKLIALLSASLLLGATGTTAQVYNSFINCVDRSAVSTTNLYSDTPATLSSDACIVSRRAFELGCGINLADHDTRTNA